MKTNSTSPINFEPIYPEERKEQAWENELKKMIKKINTKPICPKGQKG